jgi:hypothetical protein|tara:strand:+ start:175 stop:369 length:195 start_codon:yes stop_codon:yes gene_type:complete
MNKDLKKEGNSILLCCGRARCPAIKKSEGQKDHYEITDDFGGAVSLTREQLSLIKDALKELDNS